MQQDIAADGLTVYVVVARGKVQAKERPETAASDQQNAPALQAL